MGSVLGIVLLLAIVPLMLDLPRRRRLAAWFFALLALHGGAFLALEHGNHSHRELTQILALASVLAWLPLLTWMLRGFEWPRESRAWLASTLGWGVVLAASGILAFLPGILERVKFGDALVAHAHVALAGFVTSWNMGILATLMRDTPLGVALGARSWAIAWNVTLILHLAALAGLASLEVVAPGALVPAGAASSWLLLIRLVAGLGQLVVSGRWLTAAWRAVDGDAARPAACVPSLAGRAA
jgi:cytochrome c oxidase cbb3-type subunit 1